MKNRWTNLTSLLAIALIAAALAACGSGPSQPGRFYVLASPTSLTAAKPQETLGKDFVVGVGPIELPPHLDRTQIVTQVTQHRLDLMDLDQWAEPLKDGFTRVLAQNLSRLLGTDRIVQFPWRRPFAVKLQVTVEVLRFDTDSAGESVLSARWNILDGDGQKLLHSRTSTYRDQTSGKEVESIVAAMSRNLAALSQDISASTLAISR
jgi:uncharacterized protein